MDEEFFERHAPDIVRFFRGLLRGDVEDLVQDTFMRWLERRDTMRPGNDPRAFLFGIAWNVFHEHLRKLGRDRMVDPDVESMAQLEPGPSTIAHHRREHRMLAEALRRLPVGFQTILQLHYWEKLTAVQLAEIEGISPSGMRTRLKRARALLAQELVKLRQTTPLCGSTTSNPT
jgi:RNA polymerase sigma-70 factor (ECF subfamily)